jgi:hypothetical protein
LTVQRSSRSLVQLVKFNNDGVTKYEVAVVRFVPANLDISANR